MPVRRYFEFSTAANPDSPVPVGEDRFVELRRKANEFDVFLWVDGPDALAGRRDARKETRQGQFHRASTSRCPDRLPTDEELRPAAAATMLAVVRADGWITPSDAFRAGNPEAGPTTATNAYVTLCKGRSRLDFKRAHEVWESFDLQRKGPASPEASLRFRPGRAAAERRGELPIELRWCIAWSEPIAVQGPAAVPAPAPAVVRVGRATVQMDTSRKPRSFLAYGLDIIVRDAVIDVASGEVILLVGLRDPDRIGPFTLDTSLVHRWDAEGVPSVYAQEGLEPGPRIEVPGWQVMRLRNTHQELEQGAWIEWGCLVFRLATHSWDLSGDELDIEVGFWVTPPRDKVVRRVETVRFRVVGK